MRCRSLEGLSDLSLTCSPGLGTAQATAIMVSHAYRSIGQYGIEREFNHEYGCGESISQCIWYRQGVIRFLPCTHSSKASPVKVMTQFTAGYAVYLPRKCERTVHKYGSMALLSHNTVYNKRDILTTGNELWNSRAIILHSITDKVFPFILPRTLSELLIRNSIYISLKKQ